MTPEDRAALRALIAEAAPLPWRRERLGDGTYSIEPNVVWLGHLGSDIHTSDARLIVAAVNALPALLSALEEAESCPSPDPVQGCDCRRCLAASNKRHYLRAEKAESESAALRAEVEHLSREADFAMTTLIRTSDLLQTALRERNAAHAEVASLRARVAAADETVLAQARAALSGGEGESHG